MDPVSEAFLALHFRTAFLEKKGTEFQDWFAKLASDAYGADFEVVRPYGNQGDWKCDGRRVSSGTVFQCYGPEAPTDKKTIEKIDTDFAGATAKWPNFLKVWIFVHNHTGGQPPAVVDHLDKLRLKHPEIHFEIWGESELRVLHGMMSAAAKLAMYGPVPTAATVSGLVLQDLQPVIDVLEKREPNPNDPLPSPPSVLKLEKNALSIEAAGLLQLGRPKTRLVEMYFHKTGPVELGEKIAEAFRKKYSQLKAIGLEPDQIFSYLQEFAGVKGEPKRQAAAMAVMTYFFDRCDIFEDPKPEVVSE
jgi:hypothetical protein